MFIKIAITAVYMIVLAVSAPIVVLAQEDATTTNLSETTQQIEQSSEDVTAEKREEKRLERIEEAKQKINEKLSVSAERRIQARCIAAQIKIDTLQSSVTVVSENRQQVYSEFSSKISELIAKLQVAGVDISSLEESVNELDNIITTASYAFSDYTSILSDLSNMDCESDPQGFSALLKEARSVRINVLKLQNDVRAQVRQEIKTNLENARKTLELESNNLSEGGGQ